MAPKQQQQQQQPGGSSKKRAGGKARNYELIPGLMRFSRSTMAHKKGLWAVKSRKVAPSKSRRVADSVKTQKAEQQASASTRPRRVKGDLDSLRKSKRNSKSPFKVAHHSKPLRKSITPGTIVILVAGQHRGKRVVFLKQLKSGLLLVTGPWTYNRCPLRRVNQRYVIATKTKLNLAGINFPSTVDDNYFRRKKADKTKQQKADKTDASPFAKQTNKKYELTRARIDDQVNVDKQLVQAINKHAEKEVLKGYLCSLFQLSNKTYPHKLVF